MTAQQSTPSQTGRVGITFPGQDELGTSECEVPHCWITTRAVPSLPTVTRLTLLCLKPPAVVNPRQSSQAAVPGREPPHPPHLQGVLARRASQRWLWTTTETPALSLPPAISRAEILITEVEFSDHFSREPDSAAPATLQFPPNSFSLGDRFDSPASSVNKLGMGMRTDSDTLINFFSVMGASRDKGNHYQQLMETRTPGLLSLLCHCFILQPRARCCSSPFLAERGREASTHTDFSSRLHIAGCAGRRWGQEGG